MKNIRPLIIAIVIILLALPLAYLFYRTSQPSFDDYISKSVAYINHNQPGKSLELLEKARALNPNSPVVYNNLGVAYILMKRYDEGIAACRRAIELAPNFQLAKNNLRWGLDEKAKQQKKTSE